MANYKVNRDDKEHLRIEEALEQIGALINGEQAKLYYDELRSSVDRKIILSEQRSLKNSPSDRKSLTNLSKILVTAPNGNQFIKTRKELKEMGFTYLGMTQVMNGYCKTHKGCIFEYIGE